MIFHCRKGRADRSTQNRPSGNTAIVEMGKAVLPLVVEQMLEPDRFFSLSLYEALCDEKPSDKAWCQKRALHYVKSWLAVTAE